MNLLPAGAGIAVTLLRNSPVLSAGPERQSPPDLVAIASGAEPSSRADDTAKKDFFDAATLDPTEMKMRLMERLGEAFDIPMDKIPDMRSYGGAIREAIEKMKLLNPNASQVLAKIEKDLGLDKLGISIDTLVNAIIDPASGDAEKVDEAIKAHLGELMSEEDMARIADKLAGMGLDQAGLYSA